MSPVAAAAGATPADGTSESTATTAIRRGSARIGRTYSRATGVSISHPHSLCWRFGECSAAVGRRSRSFGQRGSVQRSVAGSRSVVAERAGVNCEEAPVVTVGVQLEPQEAPCVVVAHLGARQRRIVEAAQVPTTGADDEQARAVPVQLAVCVHGGV